MTEANEQAEPAAPPASAGVSAPAPDGGKPAATVTRGMLLWVGAGVVLLAFVASFLGASMAGAAAPAPTPTPVPTVYVTPGPSEEPLDQAELEAMIAELMPTGSVVRAGVGAPSVDAGLDGDLYIDLESANVYLRQDGVWVSVGNIRQNAAENLTGEQGEQGETGATGAQGEPGKPGKPGEPGVAGTQVSLGTGSPDPAADCGADGDIYLDTSNMAFYTCAAGVWTPQEQ
ncbi:collagen-like triple helix repeat-containing protein [Microterricola gilva]|uniref:collagen-like triple helix repeat-containing protein n=1 Tax=Microterricola gilva TaxID=393267 RepID=UPI00102BDE3C|nr:collagen-like protein [Microterricola gilva]